ncbi:MAG: helix-turn-helix domain-containing protein [Candidatus Magasanikbacteria bacterium]|nr:helix-turn-helix domain-containing protein [Candidatus Magasanikbacteria bacterium]
MPLSVAQKQEITEVLSSFGLRDKEQLVYLALLSLGPSTTTPLARKARLRPTTAESIIKRLYNDGLVFATKHASRHIYTAHEPKHLKKILEKKLEEIQKIVPLLETLKKEHTTEAAVKIYYRERFNDIFDDLFAAKPVTVYEIVAPRQIQDILGEKYHFTKRRVEKNISLKSLRVEVEEIKKYSRASHQRELREAKFLPRELTFEASIFFWKQTVAIFTTRAEGTAVVITSPVLSQMMLQLFNLLWSISRPMETETTP